MFKRKSNLAEMKLRRQAKPTGVMVISGFLGAGKTSLIQKMLAGPLTGRQVVLIENDFGDLNLDAGVLAEQGFTVRALTQGCICCSLTGEFVASVRSIIKTYHPDLILIEPSGVGKLTDIRNSLSKAAAGNLLVDRGRITVVDGLRCELYYENFADFFDDQVAEASTLFLSRTDLEELTEERLSKAKSLLRSLNEKAVIYTDVEDLLRAIERLLHEVDCRESGNPYISPLKGTREGGSINASANRDEQADFRQVTLSFPFLPDPHWPELLFRLLEQQEEIRLVRAKGIIRLAGRDGAKEAAYYELQYVPGDLRLSRTHMEDSRLTFIGPDLQGQQVAEWIKAALRTVEGNRNGSD